VAGEEEEQIIEDKDDEKDGEKENIPRSRLVRETY
jgi:hypothetical protein